MLFIGFMLGLLGRLVYTKSVTDQIYDASRYGKSARFKINLFSITFGVAFYL